MIDWSGGVDAVEKGQEAISFQLCRIRRPFFKF